MSELIGRAFRSDRILVLVTAGLLAVIALYLVPSLAGFQVIGWYQGLLPALLLTLAALQYRLREVADAVERRLWNLLILALSSWSTAIAFVIFLPGIRATPVGLLLEDVLYLLFYLLFLLAVETQPHRTVNERHTEAWRSRRRFEIQGAVFFAAGLAVYFVAIPMLGAMEEYASYFPSGILYVTFDVVILARTMNALRSSSSERWVMIYRLLLLAEAGMFATDLFDTLSFSPGDWFIYPQGEVPPALYALWFVYLLPIVWAARLRHFLPTGEAPASKAERSGAAQPYSNILLFYAFLLPVVHLIFEGLKALAEVAAVQRSFVVLVYVFGYAYLIARQQRHEENRSRILEADRRRLEAQQQQLIAELKSKNAELERFSYTVSHDFKSPLVTIDGFLGLLERDIERGNADQIKMDIEQIGSATKGMRQLLDELLKLSRSGRAVNEPQEVSSSELARRAVELVRGEIAERGVDVEISPDLPVVSGDRARLLEVFQNLVSNAVKFMGSQPQPRIEIYVRRSDPMPEFCVRDNGIGIESSYQEKIFDLFERLDSGVDGTGVGLALVQRIVEAHGGRLWVESEGEGQGCTFCFTLPRTTDPEQRGRTPRAAA